MLQSECIFSFFVHVWLAHYIIITIGGTNVGCTFNKTKTIELQRRSGQKRRRLLLSEFMQRVYSMSLKLQLCKAFANSKHIDTRNMNRIQRAKAESERLERERRQAEMEKQRLEEEKAAAE